MFEKTFILFYFINITVQLMSRNGVIFFWGIFYHKFSTVCVFSSLLSESFKTLLLRDAVLRNVERFNNPIFDTLLAIITNYY